MWNNWDPLPSPDWAQQNPTAMCLQRAKRDLKEIHELGIECRIHVLPSCESDITSFVAVIIGPEETPYHGGIFRFAVRLPPNYPLGPPRVRNLTTSGGQVRFGPNFYADGKVCLSILGTWTGPGWVVTQSVLSTLQSIQSLMTADAIKNEPGYESLPKGSPELAAYDAYIRHETIRVAVLEELRAALGVEQTVFSAEVRNKIFRNFLDNCGQLMDICNKYCHLDGKLMENWPRQRLGRFSYGNLRAELLDIQGLVEAVVLAEEIP